MTDQLEDYRRDYAQQLVRSIGNLADQRLRDAFQSVPRESFLDTGPWKIPDLRGGYIESPTDNVEFLYQDILFALIAEKGINNGQPSLHARNIAALAVNRGESILHIGAGTGYYTAILAEITGAKGSVVAFEFEPSLAKRAIQNLQHWPQTSVIQGSVFDHRLPSADIIYANAGTPQIETTWVLQLKDGGRLLFPLTCSNGTGVMLKVVKEGEYYTASATSRCGFIGCVGTANEQASEKLATLFHSGKADRISHLFLAEPQKPESILLSGDGWYLCSE